MAGSFSVVTTARVDQDPRRRGVLVQPGALVLSRPTLLTWAVVPLLPSPRCTEILPLTRPGLLGSLLERIQFCQQFRSGNFRGSCNCNINFNASCMRMLLSSKHVCLALASKHVALQYIQIVVSVCSSAKLCTHFQGGFDVIGP